jgi:hypothetical protein
MKPRNLITIFILSASCSISLGEVDWSEGFEVPEGGRPNPYMLPEPEYKAAIEAGKIHTQVYPVTVSGLIPPYRPVARFFENPASNPIKALLQKIFKALTSVSSIDDVMDWVGLHKYPAVTDRGIYSVPLPKDQPRPGRLGFGLIQKDGVTGFSVSCAACHSSNLFGKTVLGMTNRFPRANHAFLSAQKMARFVDPHAFQVFTRATEAETELLSRSIKNLKSIGIKEPLLRGLDTSLAQVALTLAKRNSDPWATRNPSLEARPRFDSLQVTPADSKPAVWWNLKYKNRWLSDGSVVSGNPIFTNILWNEIGRGSDLKELDQWLNENAKVIQELTTAIFSMEAPRFTDFFPAERIDIISAKRGESLFNQSCNRCHGEYRKAWSLPESEMQPLADRLRTLQVVYRKKTPVVKIGTDPMRANGMSSLEQLNDLMISKRNQAVVKVQKGYVPPPLVGIWARWPYFHNNSVPDLCSVLTASVRRPVTFYSGEANSPITDFDSECNGYPLGNKTPPSWKVKAHLYDTRRAGLGNFGHDEGIISKNGVDVYSLREKRDLIQFLQTL